MYTVLYDVNENGWKLSSKTYADLDLAKKVVNEMGGKNSYRNVRLLQEVVESPYEKLYHKLYEDFVSQYAGKKPDEQPQSIGVEIRE